MNLSVRWADVCTVAHRAAPYYACSAQGVRTGAPAFTGPPQCVYWLAYLALTES
jgi:hypothetical protein